MKKLLLPLFLACSIGASGQTMNQWLGLTPVTVGQPALSNVKDVNNKTFTEAMLLDYSGIDVNNLVPDDNRQEDQFHELRWSKATLTADTVLAEDNARDATLNYYATYLSNTEWIKGELNFRIFGNAIIYIDGVKKATINDNKPSNKIITCELVPGKHTIIVKTVTRGGKLFAASFKPGEEFKESGITFSTSPKRGKSIDDVLNGKKISSLGVSPSGKYTIVGIRDIIGGKSTTTTGIYRVADKKVVYSFRGSETSNLQWVPGEEKLSWLQKEGEGFSLYTYDVERQQLSCPVKVDKQLSGYTWSPDRSYLIYYARENFSDPNWQLRKLAGIEDRQDYFRSRSYLCKYDFATGVHTRLTWGNLSTSLMDISHNGEKLLISTNRPDYNEFPYGKQSIYLMDVKTLQLDTLWKDRQFFISCNFSPDDRQLLISGGPSAFGKTGENIGKNPLANQYDTQLYIYDLANKQVNPITKDFAPSISNSVWHKNGTIYIEAIDADFVRLFCYSGGRIKPVECPGDMLLSMSFATEGNRMMYIASDVSYPARIYDLNLDDNKSEMWDNPAREQFENVVFGEVKDWDYNYRKGTVIDGRYYLPADFDPTKKYPLIVYYYGGTTPVGRNFGGRWPFNMYAANGYIVYVMQPSGAIGYGQEFSARHQNNWAKTTADEIIASTKAFLKAHPFVDATKVGCMGASYGGFTTMYLTTQTDIFTCAISHAGISSISSYWGEGYWGYQYSTNASGHSFPWNRKDIYVDQSPLFNADKVHNPILLIHGTKDVNVPTGESIQFYTALKLLGKDAELVFVKDADHAVVDYNQRILWNNTILAYFAKYLKAQPAWWNNIYPDKNL